MILISGTPAGPRRSASLLRVDLTGFYISEFTCFFGLSILLAVLNYLALRVSEGFLLIGLMASLLFAVLSTQISLFWILIGLVFNNLFVSLALDGSSDTEKFGLVRGAPFLYLLSSGIPLCAIHFGRILKVAQGHAKIFYYIISWFILALVYFVYGISTSGFQSAAAYFRNFVSMPLLFIVGAVVGWDVRHQTNAKLNILTVSIILYLCIEMFLPRQLYEFINYIEFSNLKDVSGRFYVDFDSLISQNEFTFFNQEWFSQIRLFRLVGPNLHSVSFGYLCAILALQMVVVRKWHFVLALVIGIAAAGSKGALILFAFPLIYLLLIRQNPFSERKSFYLICVLIISYTLSAIILGIDSGNYHVIGLLGGLKGLASNFLGHGLGAGGNLGTKAISVFHGNTWDRVQQTGLNFGVESGVGVIAYQLGVFLFIPLGALFCIGIELWELSRSLSRTPKPLYQSCAIAGIATLAILGNSFMQEEALFSPLAGGLVGLFAGMALAGATRIKLFSAD